MTHTQTQGADGAGTNGTLWCMHIAGPDDVHAAPDFWTALAWSAELNAAVAARAIKQGWAGDDNWPLAQATVQRWPWSAEGHADSLATELAARAAQKATPAPAATPGVPDSVRALTERLSRAVKALNGSQLWLDDNSPWRIMLKRGRFNAAVAEAHPESAPGDGEWSDGASICAIVNEAIKLDALIAAQPAGQAGDAGANPVRAALEASMEARGANRQQAFFREAAARIAPAPNSTRTGAAEEDWREDPSADERWCAGVDYAQEQLCHVLGVDPSDVNWDAATETLDGDMQAVICTILAAWGGDDWQALAARPEAPSDAGWSFDMEAAPRDGTPINVGRDNGCGWDLLVVWWSKSATEYPWHTEGGGEYPEHRFDCWATLTPPSDPAPSGQAEG